MREGRDSAQHANPELLDPHRRVRVKQDDLALPGGEVPVLRLVRFLQKAFPAGRLSGHPDRRLAVEFMGDLDGLLDLGGGVGKGVGVAAGGGAVGGGSAAERSPGAGDGGGADADAGEVLVRGYESSLVGARRVRLW